MSNSPDYLVDWVNMRQAQIEITRWANEQFPGRTDHAAVFKLVVHEIPELMIHKKEKGLEGIGTELADAMILLLDLASLWGVDMAQAVEAKMGINYHRTWERDAHGIMQHVPDVLLGPLPTCPNCSNSDQVQASSDGGFVCVKCEYSFDDIPF